MFDSRCGFTERCFSSSLQIKTTLRTLKAPERDWQMEPCGSNVSNFEEAEEEEEDNQGIYCVSRRTRGRKREEPSRGLNKSKPVQPRQTICNNVSMFKHPAMKSTKRAWLKPDLCFLSLLIASTFSFRLDF